MMVIDAEMSATHSSRPVAKRTGRLEQGFAFGPDGIERISPMGGNVFSLDIGEVGSGDRREIALFTMFDIDANWSGLG